MAKQRGLGKGLDLIFAENSAESDNSSVLIKLSEIEPNREQPRKEFDDQALMELADSISQHGILQPLLLRPFPDGGYQIVAGERRWRAARMAGLTQVPAVIREMTEQEVAELALIENLQREDLSPLEEAMGYKSLMDTYALTQEQAAKRVGKSRPVVANALRLLQLPVQIQQLLREGRLSAGHARTLLSFPNEESMLQAAKLTVEKDLSVRELEKLAKAAAKQQQEILLQEEKKPSLSGVKYYDEVRLSLCEYLGRRVKVEGDAKKGSLQIEFYGQEDLQTLLQTLSLLQKEPQ